MQGGVVLSFNVGREKLHIERVYPLDLKGNCSDREGGGVLAGASPP